MVNQRSTTTTTTPRSRPAGSNVPGQSGQAVQQVTDTAKETVSKATDAVQQQADTQLDRVGSGLERVAETLHETGDTLRQNDQAMVGDYVHKAAGQIERASDYLQTHSVSDIIEEVQSYARREPVVTIAVAAGIGFLAARLLKASMRSGATSGGASTWDYRTTRSANPVIEAQYAPGGSRYGNGA